MEWIFITFLVNPSFTLFPKPRCFIKTTRRKLVTLAGEVIKHARSIEIRMMKYSAKEVNTLSMIFSGSFFKAENAEGASPPNVVCL